MTDVTAGRPGQTEREIGLTAWLAPNPYGEQASYLLLHPRDEVTADQLQTTAMDIGLRRVDDDGDIPRIGTGTLFVVLASGHFQIRSQDEVWVEHVVSDDWCDAARARRYVVVAVGIDRMKDEELRDEFTAYLGRSDRIFTGLVNVV